MTPIEELNMLLALLWKYDLPLDSDLETAINQKKVNEGGEANENSLKVPSNAVNAKQNRYILQFCYCMLTNFKDALSDRDRKICEMHLFGEGRLKASEKYDLTEERIRQLFNRSIQRISKSFQKTMNELLDLRADNSDLRRKIFLLENEIKKTNILEKVHFLEYEEKQLCNSAFVLLDTPIKNLQLSKRALNVLLANNVAVFREIPQLSLETLVHSPQCGRKTVTELRQFLSKFSLEFDMNYEDVVFRLMKYKDEDIKSAFVDLPSNRRKKRNKTISSIAEKEEEIVFWPDFYEIPESEEKKPNTNDIVIPEEEKTIVLTKEIIDSARTPNGGITKSQLAAIGIAWPPPKDWSHKMIGTMISPSQLEKFKQIVYVSKEKKQ